MADVAHKKTDEMLTELEKKIKREYNTARKEVQAKMNAYFEKVAAQEKVQKELLKAGKITQQEYNDWMIRKMAMGKRWEELRDNLADDMNNHRKIAQSITKGFQADAYALNHNFAVYQCEHDGKCSTVYQLYDRHTVERLMEQDQQLMPPAGARVRQAIKEGRAKRWNKQRLQSALTQSILQGESVGQIADRVSKAVSVMSYNDAIRYARTMITGAECAGRNDGFKAAEEMGIDLEKEWIATLDDRTRHSHREMHGVRVLVDDTFPNGCRFPADPYGDPSEVYNCRCTMKASIKGFDRQRVESSPKMGDLSFEEWQGVKGASTQNEPVYQKFQSGDDAVAYFGARPERALRRTDREEYDRQKRAYEESMEGRWRDKLTIEQESAIGMYSGDSYSGINGLLRGEMTERQVGEWDKYESDEHKIQNMIPNIESAIGEFELDSPIKVFRTCEEDIFIENDIKVGSVFKDKGFVSTSTLQEKVASGNVVMEIDVPAGKGNGAWINSLSGAQDEEYEFLLQRGSQFEVSEIEKVGQDTVIKMKWIGAEPEPIEYASKEHVIELWKKKGVPDDQIEEAAKRI